MNILALETSTEACSVALLKYENELFSEFELTPRQHTRYLPIMLEAVLQRAGLARPDINLVVFANGPGAFTGVRIAASTAQGIAIGLSVPVLGISTLAALAQQACDELAEESVMAALDARMGEVYCGWYKKNNTTQLVELQGEERLIKLEDLQLIPDAIPAGSGWEAWQQAGFASNHEQTLQTGIYPTAAALVKLAQHEPWFSQSTSADKATINYLRNKVAEKKPVA